MRMTKAMLEVRNTMVLHNLSFISRGAVREYHFNTPHSQHRFDFAMLDVKLAIELEGGVWSKGRHVRGEGFVKDMWKYNRAAELGWTLLRYEPTKIDYDQIRKVYLKKWREGVK